MANDLNQVFQAVNQTVQVSGSEETVRSIVSSPLATGVRPSIGTSFLPKTQTLRVASGADPSQTGGNQNDRAQVPPATTNKLPRIYGEATTGGVVVDVHKSSANTIFVAFAISETRWDRYDQVDNTNSLLIERDWELKNLYWNDYALEPSTFGDAGAFGNNAKQMRYMVPIDRSTSNVDIRAANVLNVWAWAGNSEANAQIFPYYPQPYQRALYGRNAYDVFPTWDANVTMANTVFAIAEIDRLNEDIDPTANVEIDEVGDWRFTIKTLGYDISYPAPTPGVNYNLYNPSQALKDYLVDDVYGVGLVEADLDLQSFTDWYDYCDETTYYATTDSTRGMYNSANTYNGETYYVYSQERWRTDGFINTQRPVNENIDEICKSGQATLTYDNRQGKFKVLVNRKMTAGEQANAFLFNSDNIISGIQVNSTDLYSLYNFADCTFPNYLQQDQPDTIIVSTPANELLIGEPVSGMNFQLTTVSDRPRAAQMANNSLKASRIGNMCRFDADYSTLGVQVGDFVKITDGAKGWDEKFWRVMRVSEIEGDAGELVMQFSCIEYDEFVYEDIIYADETNQGFATGLGTRENLPAFSFVDPYRDQTPQFSLDGTVYDGYDIVLVDNPGSGTGNTYYANGVLSGSGISISSLTATIFPQTQLDFYNEPWLALTAQHGFGSVAANIPGDFGNATISMVCQDDNGTRPAFTTTSFTAESPGGIQNWAVMPLSKISNGTYKATLSFINYDTIPGRRSRTASTPNISFTNGRINGNSLLNTYGIGSEIQQTISITPPGSGFGPLHTPIHYDFSNVKYGEFTFTTNYTPTWSSYTPGVDDIAFTPTGNVTFVNDSNIDSHTFTFGGGGIQYTNITSDQANSILNIPQTVTSTFNSDPAFYGLGDNWYASRANVTLYGEARMTGGTFNNVSWSMVNRDSYYRTV